MLIARPVVLPWDTLGDSALPSAETTPEFSMLGSCECLTGCFLSWSKVFIWGRSHYGEVNDSSSGLSITSHRSERPWCVKCGYCPAKLESISQNHTGQYYKQHGGPERRCTDCGENPIFDNSVIPKNIVGFF